MTQLLTSQIMLKALSHLDSLLSAPLTLIIGGGGSMVLAHRFPLATTDIDAIPRGMEVHELDPFIKQTSMDLNLSGDWMNPYFSTFSYTLPASYSERLIVVFSGKYITAKALGMEDMLIMKCFAHRKKDIGHAKTLIKQGADVDYVEKHILSLLDKNIPHAQKAIDFLDELREQS